MIRSLHYLILCFFMIGLPTQGWSAANFWDKAHNALTASKTDQALGYINQLRSQKDHGVPKDDLNLLEARAYYQAGNYKMALKLYRRISKKSDLWLSSVEERAWAKIRMGQINRAIADTKTLLSPVFVDIASPETFFLSSYVAHKVCDFQTVFHITDAFKKRNKVRIQHLEKMAKMESTRGIVTFLNDLTAKGLEPSLNPQVMDVFPKNFLKDEQFLMFAKIAKGKNVNQLIDIRKRLAKLAKSELVHYKDVIKKLHLIEGDSIQRLYMDPSLLGKRANIKNHSTRGKYDLVFPFEEKDVWVDEFDHLQVRAQSCPEIKYKGA